MKSITIFFLLFLNFTPYLVADLFDIYQFVKLELSYPLEMHLSAESLDFDGDGHDDFLTQNPDDNSEINSYFGMTNYLVLDTNNRRNVAPSSSLFLNPHFHAVHHSISDRDHVDRLVLVTKENAQIISFLNDPIVSYFDRYTTFDIKYQFNGLKEIYFATIGLFTHNSNCMLLCVNRLGMVQMEFFPIFKESIRRDEYKEPVAVHPISEIPRAVHVGKINDDDYDDVLFVMKDHWLIWLIHPDGISIIGSYTIPFPDESIKTQSVLFQPTSDISLLLGVESSLDDEMAFLTIKNEGDEHHFMPVSQKGYLPNKQFIGTKLTFYQWEDSYTSIPILLIGNPYNIPTEVQNPYFVYTLTSSPEPELKLIQNIDFLPESIQENNVVILNTPLTIGDFNGDQITDLLFSCVTNPVGKPQNKRQNFLIINGQPQTTAIPAREWLRQD